MGVDVLCNIPTQSPELVREREEKERKRRISMDQKLLLKSIIKVRFLSAEMIDRNDTLLPITSIVTLHTQTEVRAAGVSESQQREWYALLSQVCSTPVDH